MTTNVWGVRGAEPARVGVWGSRPQKAQHGARPAGTGSALGGLRLDRRDLFKLGGLTIGAATLAACGGGGSGSEPGTVAFQGWDFEAKLVQQNIDRFVKQSKIKVDYTPITSAQYVQKTVAQYTGGTQPDALYVYDDSLAGWITAGYLQPIDGLDGVDKIYDGIFEGNAQTMSYEGKRYGVPYYTDTQALLYNAELVGKAGITTPPKTLQELGEQAKKVKDAGVLEFPLAFTAQLQDTWWAWFWGLVYSSGGTMFDDDLKPVMDSDGVAADVLTWLQQGMKEQWIDPASIQLLPVPQDNAILAGQYAFAVGARYAARKYNDPAVSQVAGKLKMALVPSVDGDVHGTVSNTRMYCLSKDTEVKDDAMKLLNYLGGYGDDGDLYTAKFWFKEQGLGFAFKELGEDPEIKAALETWADPAVYQQLAEIAIPRNVILAPWYSEFETAMQKQVQQVMTDQATPADAVKAMAAAATDLAKKYE